MQYPNKKLANTATDEASSGQNSSGFWLSLATGSMLLGVLGTQALYEWLEGLGQASEEIFRGDRLPVLNVPHCQDDNQP